MIFIIFRLFFFLFIIFSLFVFAMGAFLWLKVRLHLRNPFHQQPEQKDDQIIEGEFKVISEKEEK